jgi:hypothetical protein
LPLGLMRSTKKSPGKKDDYEKDYSYPEYRSRTRSLQ